MRRSLAPLPSAEPTSTTFVTSTKRWSSPPQQLPTAVRSQRLVLVLLPSTVVRRWFPRVPLLSWPQETPRPPVHNRLSEARLVCHHRSGAEMIPSFQVKTCATACACESPFPPSKYCDVLEGQRKYLLCPDCHHRRNRCNCTHPTTNNDRKKNKTKVEIEKI